jgi:hypothetical protein
MDSLELLVREPAARGGRVRVSALLRASPTDQGELWFSADERLGPAVTNWADPFVVAALWWAARSRAPLVVKGAPVSPSLLRNLELFQRIWGQWNGWPLVPIEPEEERERPVRPTAALAAFSGGVDSAYTAWRHAPNRADATASPVGTCLMVHGFDVPIADQDGFRGAEERGRRMLASVGIELATVVTNIRGVNADWEVAHGLALAAALSLFAGGFGTGLIASSCTEDLPVVPWGSNPFTDVLLGSQTFQIIHDGDAHRMGKVAGVAVWPEARRFLRVCWAGPRNDRNCGRCRKCLGTAMAFRALGLEPECFEQQIGDDDLVAGATWPEREAFTRLSQFFTLEAADARGIEGDWVRALRETVGGDKERRLLDRAESWRAARQAASIVAS